MKPITNPFDKAWPCVVVKYGNASTSYSIDMPGCGATGATNEESLANLAEAITLHLLGIIEDKEEIPKPGSVKHTLQDSEKLVMVMPAQRNRND